MTARDDDHVLADILRRLVLGEGYIFWDDTHITIDSAVDITPDEEAALNRIEHAGEMTACALCGHTDHATWATVPFPLPANAASSTHIILSLCHEDDHSCYHQWTAAILDPNIVESIFIDCLFREGEHTTNHVAAEGIVNNVWFNAARLDQHREEIEVLLKQLPDQYMKSGGGGWSFLNACNDKHGNQWTGLHQRMEQLIQLGIGLGRVSYSIPREMWSVLPGGMPYFVVNDDWGEIDDRR